MPKIPSPRSYPKRSKNQEETLILSQTLGIIDDSILQKEAKKVITQIEKECTIEKHGDIVKFLGADPTILSKEEKKFFRNAIIHSAWRGMSDAAKQEIQDDTQASRSDKKFALLMIERIEHLVREDLATKYTEFPEAYRLFRENEEKEKKTKIKEKTEEKTKTKTATIKTKKKTTDEKKSKINP